MAQLMHQRRVDKMAQWHSVILSNARHQENVARTWVVEGLKQLQGLVYLHAH